MKWDTGTVITILAAVLFYLHIFNLQRKKVRRLRSKTARQADRNQKGAPAKSKKSPKESLALDVRSWYLVGAGVLLITLGGIFYATDWLGIDVKPYWWVAITAGIAILGYGFK
ncbi:MAG: hypothetical protein U1B80_00835 [Anaerolineaceae bacterium]|nr:hypothetical protein [Anaerolineaceae bacterium]